jgi:hypothetical protein
MAGMIAGRRSRPIVRERHSIVASVAEFQNTDRIIKSIRLSPRRRHQTGSMGQLSSSLDRLPNSTCRCLVGDVGV